MKTAFEKKLDRTLRKFKKELSKYPGDNAYHDVDYDIEESAKSSSISLK